MRHVQKNVNIGRFLFSPSYWTTGFTTTNFIIYLCLFLSYVWSYNSHFLFLESKTSHVTFWGLIFLSSATVRIVGIFRMVKINIILKSSELLVPVTIKLPLSLCHFNTTVVHSFVGGISWYSWQCTS